MKRGISIGNNQSIPYSIISLAIILFSYFHIEGQVLLLGSDNIENENWIFLTSCLSVALFEELLFRVFVFEILFNALKDKMNLFKIIIISSAVFGLAHVTNFFNPNYVNLSVINQIVMTFGAGVLLQSIYIRLNSITCVILLHTLINYFGMYKSKLLPSKEIDNIVATEVHYSLSEFFSTFLTLSIMIVILVLPISILLIRRNHRNKVC
ncbi:MAG: CPBP family intramembrane metalloprotease [Labilibaculum sp.]|nr:CPBP family intramembrane glutamic endopeptidase [Labilibaculum sp.]MBI9056299.1 CPBP family intramembrane metalloprotease [Labilibaculum sp.]